MRLVFLEPEAEEPAEYLTKAGTSLKAVTSTIRMAKKELADIGCPKRTVEDMLTGACITVIKE